MTAQTTLRRPAKPGGRLSEIGGTVVGERFDTSRNGWLQMRYAKRVITLLIFIQFGTARAARSQDALATFRAAYPAAFDKLESSYSRFIARGTSEMKLVNGGSTVSSRFEVRRSGTDRKVTVVQTNRDGSDSRDDLRETVIVINQKECFLLMRPTNGGSGFAVNNHDLRGADGRFPSDSAGSNYWRTVGGVSEMPLYAPYRPMREYLNAERYRLDSGMFVVEAGVRVFRLELTSLGANRKPVGLGTVVEFLPDRGWVARRFEQRQLLPPGVKAKTPATPFFEIVEIDFRDDGNGVAVPQNATVKRPELSATYVFEEFSLGADSPSREFELTSYRMPDLSLPPPDPARSRLPLWLTLAGGAGVVLAVYLKVRSSR